MSAVVRIEAAARTHVGCVRTANQDAFALGSRIAARTDDIALRMPPSALSRATLQTLVADGMGGHPCGERASEIAVRAVAASDPVDLGSAEAALLAADAALYAEMNRDERTRRMGTTLAGLIVGPLGLDVFGVGDCFAAQLTQGLVRALLRPAAEIMETSITDAALGGLDAPRPLKIDRFHLDDPIGRYVLASDGLLRDLEWEDLRAVLTCVDLAPADQVDGLIARVLDAGARDNITCAIVEVTRVD